MRWIRRASRGRRDKPSSELLVGCWSEVGGWDCCVVGAGVVDGCGCGCGGFEALFGADSVAGEAMIVCMRWRVMYRLRW